MGFFDFLSKNKGDSSARKLSDRDIARLGKVVGEKLAQDYDRQEAIAELGKCPSAASAAALLKRFDFQMDPSITDQEEKESAASGIVAAGAEALAPIRDYCARAKSLSWPLKVLKQIVEGQELTDELLGILDGFDTEYTRDPQPKIQLLQELAEHPSADVREAVEPFLGDMSEPVRFAAVTTLLAHSVAEVGDALVEALLEEESLRVKNRIAQGLAEGKFEVPAEQLAAFREALPPEFRLDGGVPRRAG
ncbi:MAG: HEAT repeat domain-containing protein [Polyangiaceae bacterium]|nr:HEAT repeat domain-containing protein [Polyangiaceae bacterium]